MAWWRESMKTHEQRIAWWREARFGMFIHWGVYSELAGEWQGQPVQGYAEHIMRKCRIPIDVYKREAAGRFNPTKFDAHVSIVAETATQAAKPQGWTALITWPKVAVKTGETRTVAIKPDGSVQAD